MQNAPQTVQCHCQFWRFFSTLLLLQSQGSAGKLLCFFQTALFTKHVGFHGQQGSILWRRSMLLEQGLSLGESCKGCSKALARISLIFFAMFIRVSATRG